MRTEPPSPARGRVADRCRRFQSDSPPGGSTDDIVIAMEPETWIVADLGGTNIRLAIAAETGVIKKTAITRSWEEASSLALALKSFLDETGIDPSRVSRLVVAFAGPAIPVDGQYRFTNVPIAFTRAELKAVLPGARTTIVNDFAAQAYCLMNLKPHDVEALQPFDGTWPEGNRVIYGPGTGLGVAQLVMDSGKPLAIAGEGGNVAFAPPTDELARLRHRIVDEVARRRPENPDTTMKPRQEDVLSGPGLENLHFALHGKRQSAEQISDLAHAGAAEAVDTFTHFFDSLAGMGADLALTCLPQGGIFISGGMTRRNLKLLDRYRFRRIFEARWRYREILTGIPVFVLTRDNSGLEGAAIIASMP
ncbi:MAG: glucokinase [Paracoccaceae bacterium]|nr:glucokinase [Paracoccaceae bacterium]